jgi:hypothetical protein
MEGVRIDPPLIGSAGDFQWNETLELFEIWRGGQIRGYIKPCTLSAYLAAGQRALRDWHARNQARPNTIVPLRQGQRRRH